LVRWACRKYKKLRNNRSRAWAWLMQVIDRRLTCLRFGSISRTVLGEPRGAIPLGLVRENQTRHIRTGSGCYRGISIELPAGDSRSCCQRLARLIVPPRFFITAAVT
jgi:hypothetical protein